MIDERSFRRPGRARPDARSALPERLLGAGVVLFGVGALAAIATLLPLFLQTDRLPTAIYLAAVILSPLGLALCLFSLLAEVRRRRLMRTSWEDPAPAG